MSNQLNKTGSKLNFTRRFYTMTVACGVTVAKIAMTIQLHGFAATLHSMRTKLIQYIS